MYYRKMSIKTPPTRGILGLCLSFVIASITYSTYVICVGTDGIGPKIMLIPQVAFGLLVIFKAFSKVLE